jgi:copper chaperone CopZ
MTRKTTTLMLGHAECIGGSAFSIERVMRKVPGVLRVYVNPATEAAYVEYDADRCTEEDLTSAVADLGIDTRRGVPQPRPGRPPSHTTRRPMPEPRSRSRSWWAFAGFAAIAVFFLITEHRAHLFGALPFLFLLACPLLHMFGHGDHGDHGGHGAHGGHAHNADRVPRERLGGRGSHATHHEHSAADDDRRDDTW